MNFCKDCKHCEETLSPHMGWDGVYPYEYRCGRKRDPVTGEATECRSERAGYPTPSRCGEVGIFFEPKEDKQND